MTIIIHHLQVSQSERIPWLCEELGVDYELELYKRAPLLAPAELKALHPSGTAPVVEDGDLTLAESCAIIEYIAHRHGGGRLFVAPSSPAYADFLFWWHWVDGTFMPALGRRMMARAAGLGDENPMVRIGNDRFEKALRALDERLGAHEWLAGAEFTAADIMVVFGLTTMRYFSPFSLAGCPNVVAYLGRVAERPAYQRAMKKGDPDMELVLGPEPPKPLM
ncbi:glutathione S-transferase [Xylariaceae sp. FL0804]|nr:glutathione S-transferase [Xylariaceae sp. FL0804]